jgi:hypothetical protein
MAVKIFPPKNLYIIKFKKLLFSFFSPFFLPYIPRFPPFWLAAGIVVVVTRCLCCCLPILEPGGDSNC